MQPDGGGPADAGPIDGGNVIAPEETAQEGASDRAPATAEAAKPAEYETDVAGHHAIPHPGSSSEPVDAAAIIAPEETALEGASDTEPGAVSDTEDDEKNRQDFRRIAERRVRLGLLLAEVGRNNNIHVTQDELNQAILREARRHPGYERQVLDFYRQNSDAVAQSAGPRSSRTRSSTSFRTGETGRAQRYSAGADGRRPGRGERRDRAGSRPPDSAAASSPRRYRARRSRERG